MKCSYASVSATATLLPHARSILPLVRNIYRYEFEFVPDEDYERLCARCRIVKPFHANPLDAHMNKHEKRPGDAIKPDTCIVRIKGIAFRVKTTDLCATPDAATVVLPESLRFVVETLGENSRECDADASYLFEPGTEANEVKVELGVHERYDYESYASLRDAKDVVYAYLKKVLVPITSHISACTVTWWDDARDDDMTCEEDDDELRCVMYIYAVAKPVFAVQFGRRKPVCRVRPPRHIYGKLKVYPYIYDSECETWPEELADWWCSLSSKSAVSNVVRCLREYYYEDVTLLAAADWLEEQAKHDDVMFEFGE